MEVTVRINLFDFSANSKAGTCVEFAHPSFQQCDKCHGNTRPLNNSIMGGHRCESVVPFEFQGIGKNGMEGAYPQTLPSEFF